MTHPNPFHACEPALADRPPAGPAWMHEVKWDGYRVIARKDGDRVRLWARNTSDYPARSRASALSPANLLGCVSFFARGRGQRQHAVMVPLRGVWLAA